MPAGTSWGGKWEYSWFKGGLKLPETAYGKRIVLDVNVGGESTVFIDRKVAGTVRANWVRERHHFISDLCLCEEGAPGKSSEVLVECYAGSNSLLMPWWKAL